MLLAQVKPEPLGRTQRPAPERRSDEESVTEQPERPSSRELVTVLASSDFAALALAKLALEAGGVPFVAKGVGIQDLFGVGRLGGLNLVTGPVQLHVRAEDAALAQELLADIRESPGETA